MWKRTVLVALITLGVGVPAFAQTPTSPKHPMGINAREARQAARIKDGKADGQLTKAELDKLKADEAAIRAEEKVYRDSGKGLDSAEYKALEDQLNKTSAQIYRDKHNNKTPGGGQ